MKSSTIILLLFIFFFTNCKNKEVVKSHAETMLIFPKPTMNIKKVGIYLYDGFNSLDAFGPYQVLGEMMGVDVFFVAKKKGMVKNANDLEVKVEHDFSDTDSLDILVIPGGFKETYQMSDDTMTLNWIKRIDKTTQITASVCTGAWILGATGLLKGKNATTHWYGKDILKTYGANVKDERYVKDGKYWSSAGVTAGMDMSLAIVNEIMGEAYTKAAMLDLEYDPKPPFKAGSENNTEANLVTMMREMYDAGIKPLQKK